MAVTIPPLPNPRSGKCPWCKAGLCDSYYEDTLPIEVADLEDEYCCPKCHWPITVFVDEQTVTTFDVSIKARRTQADRKYMRAMNVEEPKPKGR